MALITIAEFKAARPEIDTGSIGDTELAKFIDRAEATMAKWCNVDGFTSATVTDEITEGTVDSFGNLTVFATGRIPITSLTSLSLTLGSSNIDMTLEDGDGTDRFTIPTHARSITYPQNYVTDSITSSGLLLNSNLALLRQQKFFTKMTYVGGYSTVPEDLKDACMLWVSDMVMRKNNLSGVQSYSQGAISVTYGSSNNSDMIADAKSILQSYKRIPF